MFQYFVMHVDHMKVNYGNVIRLYNGESLVGPTNNQTILNILDM